ncbi:MAG: ankyrin repeat domain-containing protein [Treponema sp.]
MKVYIRQTQKTAKVVISLLSCFLFFSCTTTKTLIQMIRARDVEGVKAHFNTDEITTKDANGLSLLHIAVKEDEPAIIAFLLKMGADLEERDPAGRTPLIAAVEDGCLRSAQTLAEQNANLFATAKHGKTAFQIAIDKGCTESILNPMTILQKDADGRTPLHCAAEVRNEAAVQSVLAAGSPCQDKDAEGRTPLAIAYQYPQEQAAAAIAANLLRAGVRPLQGEFAAFETATLKRNYGLRFGEGDTLLHITARAGQKGFVLFLIEEGVPLNAKNASHATALHGAVQNNQIDTVQVLLDAGASVNVHTNSGNTALHLCMTSPAAEQLLDMLLAHHADPRNPNMNGETPLHTAVLTKRDQAVLEKLIAAGAPVNGRNKRGQTPLLLAVEQNSAPQIVTLIEHGAHIHLEDVNQETPFIKSMRKGLNTVSILLTNETVVQKDSDGRSPLHVAVALGAPKEIVAHILDKKNMTNEPDKSGNTPLHTAVMHNDRLLGPILIAHNADIFFTNKQGLSPLKLALTKQDGREMWLVTEQTVRATDNVGNTPLHYAAEWNLPQLMYYIIQKGGDINAVNSNNETPLFSAVKTNSVAAADALLRSGKKPGIDLDTRDFLGNTVLHTAVQYTSLESADLILRYSNDKKYAVLHAKNSSGKTALHIAAQRGSLPFIKLFLAYNINKNVADETGKTALAEAVQCRQEATAFFLLQQGALPTPQDMYGKTVFHEAAGNASLDLITAIRVAGGNPMVRDISGATPLSLVLHGDAAMIDAVVGKDTQLSNSDGETPLHIAASENTRKSTLQQLLAKHYAIDKRDRMGSTALIIAARHKMLNSCMTLLASGADPFVVNNKGESAVSIALEQYQELLPVIHKQSGHAADSAGECLLHYAARLADTETIKTVIALAPDQLQKKSIAGEIPYNVAVRWKRPEIAQLLYVEQVQGN